MVAYCLIDAFILFPLKFFTEVFKHVRKEKAEEALEATKEQVSSLN